MRSCASALLPVTMVSPSRRSAPRSARRAAPSRPMMRTSPTTVRKRPAESWAQTAPLAAKHRAAMRKERRFISEVLAQVERHIGAVVLEKRGIAVVLEVQDLRAQRPSLGECPGGARRHVVERIHALETEQRVDLGELAALSASEQEGAYALGQRPLQRDAGTEE